MWQWGVDRMITAFYRTSIWLTFCLCRCVKMGFAVSVDCYNVFYLFPSLFRLLLFLSHSVSLMILVDFPRALSISHFPLGSVSWLPQSFLLPAVILLGIVFALVHWFARPALNRHLYREGQCVVMVRGLQLHLMLCSDIRKVIRAVL